MAWDTTFNIIRSRFKTEIADSVPLQTQYDNMAFTPPKNANWCRLSILPGTTKPVSYGAPGANRERTTGTMSAQLFTPLEAGDGTILGIAESIRVAFKRNTASGVAFETPSVIKVGRSESWWQINVDCPFRVDDIG